MANPQPYVITGSSTVFRFAMAALQKLASKSCVVLGRIRVLMGTATGLALTYSVYRTLAAGDSLVKRAESKSKKSGRVKKSRAIKKVVKPVVEVKPRDGLMPRPDDSFYLDLAASARSQPCVTSHDKAYALFLWIRVKKEADPQQVACSVARIQQYVQEVEAPIEDYCGNLKILVGVGFGPEFYQQVKGGVPQNFTNAKHSLISSSSVGGDILIHAKSNDEELLMNLSKIVLGNLPQDSVLCHEETYGKTRYPDDITQQEHDEDEVNLLTYQYTRGDMELFPPTGPVNEDKPRLLFISDTGTDDTEPKRQETAVDSKTGGSYVMTQRWVHDAKLVNSNGDVTMNQWVDRAWEECVGPPGEKKFKSQSMLGAELADISMDHWMMEAYQECLDMQKKHPESQIVCTQGLTRARRPFRILRQSLPYRYKGGESGLFFVSYASTPRYNELLLDRLINSASGGGKLNSACQNVFRLSRNVRSACWYFPGLQELRELE